MVASPRTRPHSHTCSKTRQRTAAQLVEAATSQRSSAETQGLPIQVRGGRPMVKDMTTGVLTRPQQQAPQQRIRSRYPRRLVLPLTVSAAGFLAWIVTLAVRLPAPYRAGARDVRRGVCHLV